MGFEADPHVLRKVPDFLGQRVQGPDPATVHSRVQGGCSRPVAAGMLVPSMAWGPFTPSLGPPLLAQT